MQKLNTLWRLASAASTVREIAQHTRSYQFAVREPITFYLRADNAHVSFVRWNRPLVEITTRLQAPFGWRIMTDQDDAGVYFAAGRRAVVGGLSSARFDVLLPHNAYIVLNLSGGSCVLQQVDGTLHIDPPTTDTRQITLSNH